MTQSLMMMYEIDISDRQTALVVDEHRLREAIQHVLSEERVASATISLALVDDAEIHRVNREFLDHDYPTDVISFRLDQGAENGESAKTEAPSDNSFPTQNSLEGDLIVSTETAIREASAHGWSPHDELLLYVVHGMLHLCGYDDLTDEARPVMRAREREVLAVWQVVPTGLEA